MEELNERLARVARDTMLELVSRGVPALPRNYQQVFAELCETRGIPSAAAALGLEFKTPLAEPTGPALESLVSRVASLCRSLVLVADQDGAEKEAVLPALARLAQARSPEDCRAPLETLASFATNRRKALASERLANQQCQLKATELESLSDMVLEFVAGVLPEPPEFAERLAGTRERLKQAAPSVLEELRSDLASNFRRFRATLVPVLEQKSVINDVLRSLAEQLTHAASGSEQFEASAQALQGRLEDANDLTELRELQELLIQEAGAAASAASQMRGRLGALSTQVTASQAQIGALERALVQTQHEANIDALTRVPNRRALTEWVERTLYPPGRESRGFSLLVLDLDHFKVVNDTHGHLAGDAVLTEAAKRAKLGIRDMDILARYGGEEFVLVLPDCGPPIARAVAERMCVLISRTPVSYGSISIPVTASVGVATKRAGESFTEVFERADQCVYLAKQGGRNRAMTEMSLAAIQIAG